MVPEIEEQETFAQAHQFHLQKDWDLPICELQQQVQKGWIIATIKQIKTYWSN